MKTWRSGLDYAFLGDEGVLVVMVGNQMLRMMEDIHEKVSNREVNTLAGITPEQIEKCRSEWLYSRPHDTEDWEHNATLNALCDLALAGLTARRDALEEAAKVCDKMRHADALAADEFERGHEAALEQGMWAIRALAAQPQRGAANSESKDIEKGSCIATQSAPHQNSAAGHGWITGTADVDAMNAAAAEADPSSPPQDARVRSAEATKPAAGGDTPTPLVDAAEFDAEIWEDLRTSDRIVVDSVVKADFARSLERVARMMAEALNLMHNNLDEYQRINDLGGHDDRDMRMAREALAAWRELEERK